MMKFDVITGNPMIAKQANGKYHVVYAEPPHWTIRQFHDLTFDEVSRLPFVDKDMLAYLRP